MTVLPRGAKNRRGGGRPGWVLLTALLVLAILASTTLVFTNRVELLRLAVILSLWAAVLAAFVSVIYRRQSQLDAAKARDMKFVYDLQLDREISARREYELSVEAHLRRQLAVELRAQAADEMGALRAELATLRANLQALLGTDFGDRPALGSERVMDAPIAMPPTPGRVHSSRVTPVAEEFGAHAGALQVGVTAEVAADADPTAHDTRARYQLTLDSLIDQKRLYTLELEDELIIAGDDDRPFVLLFPTDVAAQLMAKEEWAVARPLAIAFDEVLDSLSGELSDDEIELAIYPTPDSDALAVSPEQFQDDVFARLLTRAGFDVPEQEDDEDDEEPSDA